MHVTFTVYTNHVDFRVSDGRTGSDYNIGPGKWQPTLILLMHKIGALNEAGMTPGWTYEVIHA